MNAEPPLSDNSTASVRQQASAWFALNQGGQLTAEQRQAMAAWLAADAEHAKAYAQLETLWADSARLLLPARPLPRTRLSRRRFVGMGVAAGAAAVAVGTTNLWLKGIGSPFADLRTAVGERRTLQLADGFSLELAGNTALNLNLAGHEPTLELLQGEAYFSIAASAQRAIKVTTDAGQVITSNARFCLACEGLDATVTVSDGEVRVQTITQQTDLGSGLSLTFNANQASPIQHADLDQRLAWRNGRLVYFDTPLHRIVDELQRWREGKIFIMNDQLAARRVSLILNLNRPEQLLDALSKALAVRTQRYTDLVTLLYPA